MVAIPALSRVLNLPQAELDRLAVREGQGDGSLYVGPPAQRRLSLRTLVLLRWLAVAAQTAAVLGVSFGFDYVLPLPWCLGLIAASAWLNVILSLTARGRWRQLGVRETAAQLAFDLLQLTGLLMITGGVLNPFALLLIGPVTLGAAVLPWRLSLALGGIGILAAVALSLWGAPLPHAPGEQIAFPDSYRLGVTIALVTGIVVVAGYTWRASRQAGRMEVALNVTRTVLAREQRLSALGALAAAAAHELGTPLATITIVAKELHRATTDESVREDAALVLSQAQRCREILTRLTAEPEAEASDQVHGRMSLQQLLHEAIEPHLHVEGVRVEALVTGASGAEPPEIRRLPEVLHAMTSFVENAVDFAASEVLIIARFDADTVAIEVNDDGPGFSPEMLAKLGEPYVTSRPGVASGRTGHVGMGLGFFIAKTLLERTGAAFSFKNGRHGGAVVAARWPRKLIEAEPLPDGFSVV